jgi:hypothetical protein
MTYAKKSSKLLLPSINEEVRQVKEYLNGRKLGTEILKNQLRLNPDLIEDNKPLFNSGKFCGFKSFLFKRCAFNSDDALTDILLELEEVILPPGPVTVAALGLLLSKTLAGTVLTAVTDGCVGGITICC